MIGSMLFVLNVFVLLFYFAQRFYSLIFSAVQVLLSNPIVVYSPRVLPVYVYDAHADCGKNVRFNHMLFINLDLLLFFDSFCFFIFTCYLIYYLYPLPVSTIYSVAFLMLYGIALATEGWGVVASLKIYPPFAGAAVSAITLVVSFGFAVSRPCLTLKVWEIIVTNLEFLYYLEIQMLYS